MKQKTLLNSFWHFVSLNILGMLGLSFYILADTYFIANGLGTNGLAALNLAIPIFSFINATGLMLGMGGATKYAILKAQNDVRADGMFTHSIVLGASLGVFFLLVGIFGAEPLSVLLGGDADTLKMTVDYLKTLLCFAPCFIINNILIAFIRNDNAPNLAMGGMLLASFSNIILDYIFIFPLGMGMFGAALATGLAPLISIGVLSSHFFRKKNAFSLRRCKVQLTTAADIFSLGISTFVTEISSGVVVILFNIVILQIAGNTGVAAYGIVANISLIAVSIFVGIAQGMQPLVSDSYGHNNQKELKALLSYSIILSLLVAVIIYAAVNLFQSQLIAAFNREGNAILAEYARWGLLIYFIGFLFAGVNIVVISFLSASQEQGKAFVISIIRGFAAIIPLVPVLASLFGIIGVWLVFPTAELITSVVILCIWVRRSHSRVK